jgi:outer membrane protein assembly factor BamB
MDKPAKSAKISPLLFIFPLLFVFLLGVGYLIKLYLNYYILPLEPKTSGEFPRTPEWIYQASNEVVSTLVTDGNMIFIRTCCSVEAIESKKGNLLWRIDSDAPSRIRENDIVLPPKVRGNILYVPERGSTIAAYTIDTGQLLWKTPQININFESPDSARVEDFEIKDNLLFVARWSWSLSAYNLLTGDLIWETPVLQKAHMKILLDLQCLYLNENTILRCYDSANGKLLWERNYGFIITSMLLVDRTIYLAEINDSPSIAALNLDSMQFSWNRKLGNISENPLIWLAVAGDRLYATGNGLYAISTKDGTILWSTKESDVLKSLVIQDGYIIVRNKGQDLFLVETNRGQVVGHMDVKNLGSELYFDDRSPVFAKKLLIVPFGDRRIFSFRFD